jgi:hypothetical protein
MFNNNNKRTQLNPAQTPISKIQIIMCNFPHSQECIFQEPSVEGKCHVPFHTFPFSKWEEENQRVDEAAPRGQDATFNMQYVCVCVCACMLTSTYKFAF